MGSGNPTPMAKARMGKTLIAGSGKKKESGTCQPFKIHREKNAVRREGSFPGGGGKEASLLGQNGGRAAERLESSLKKAFLEQEWKKRFLNKRGAQSRKEGGKRSRVVRRRPWKAGKEKSF